jgi:hypothetical protein
VDEAAHQVEQAGRLLALVRAVSPVKADAARELAYRLYTLCERKKRAQEALAYNALVGRLAGADAARGSGASGGDGAHGGAVLNVGRTGPVAGRFPR